MVVTLFAGQVEMKAEGALEEEQWFHGILPREEVHRLLVNDGDYLVRMTYNRATAEKQYVLSVMWSAHKHFIIQKAPQVSQRRLKGCTGYAVDSCI